MVFFKCFKGGTLTILAQAGDLQDRGTTLKLYEPLTGPKALALPAKDNSMHIKSWSSEVSWEVVDSVQAYTKKKARISKILILNPSHHADDNHSASFKLLGDHIRIGAKAWNGTLSTAGEVVFDEFYWEWLEDVLSRSKDVLTKVDLYHAVYASLFSYDRHPSVIRAFLECWCSATNTLHTAQGEMSISLWDLHRIGGLPIQGKFYDEVVPSAEDLSLCNNRGLPASCRYLFWAYHRLFQDARGKSGVRISSWIRFWYWEAMRYKKPLKRIGRNKTTRPKGDSDPSGVIGATRRRSSDELRAFEDLGIAPEHVEESYLAAFLACWLCKFVFPAGDVNLVRPGVFKVASKMAAGESFSLAIPVLASIYNGLSMVSDSASTEDRAAVLPYHYVYGWLGEYFGTHFSLSTLDKSRPSSSTGAKLGPLMTKYSGVLSAKSLDDLQARALFKSCEDLRMDPLARVGSVRRGIVDNSHLRFSDLSYLISIRSGFVSLRQEDRCIIQSYSPHRFSRQFGFVQSEPGKLKERNPSVSLQAVYMHWESCTRSCTNAVITLPANDEFRSNPVTRVYARWWSKTHYENSGTASGANSSHLSDDTSREGCPVVSMRMVLLDRASAAPLQDRPVALTLQRPCLSPRHPDASEEVGDEGDSHEDGFILQQRPRVSNKRPLEDAQADSDVNFRHKKKEVFRTPQFDDREPFERDVGPSRHFDLATADVYSYTEMLFAGNLPTDGDIGDPPGVELVPNPSNFPSLPRVGGGMQEPVMRPTPLPASSEISLRGPNLSGTERLIHRISLGAAMEIKGHIEARISKCPLEDLPLLNEDLSKFVSVIDNLNVDSSSLKIKIAELMAASTEYSSLRAISLEKLSPDVRAHQLTMIDSSLAQVWSFQQAVSGDYQATEASLTSVQGRLDALAREREQLVVEASQLDSVLAEQGTVLSQYQEEISRLEREKNTTIELPVLSPTEVETLKTLEGSLGDRLRSFRDIVFK
ncbi:hypothetical protein FF1_014548 [Malus domestica]